MLITLPKKALEIIKALEKAGFSAYAVGGSVRDTLLGRPTRSWDFTTNAEPAMIQKIFPDSFYDNKFGTVGVKVDDDIFEITTYRKEGKYSDLRHPDEITWAKTIHEDLARREFTISAIATNGQEVIDKYNGLEDIKKKIIRAIGLPTDRFSEDPLRLMRAIRIATQLGFQIEEQTWQGILDNAKLIITVSSERIRDELVKILSSDFPADGVQLLANTGLLEHLLPELTAGIGMPQPGHHISDVFTHSLNSLRFCQNPRWIVRLAALIHDIGKPATYLERAGKPTFYNHEAVGARIAKDIANRWHFSKEDREKLYLLVRWHMFTVSEFITDAAVRRFIKRVGSENTTDMLDIRIGDRLGSGAKASSWRLEQFKERIIEVQKHIPSVTDLKVSGHDVMKILGLKPGPKIGQILDKLFAEITADPSKNNRDYLISQIKQKTKSQSQ